MGEFIPRQTANGSKVPQGMANSGFQPEVTLPEMEMQAVGSAQIGRQFGRVPVVRGDRQPFFVRLGRALCGHQMD